MTEGLQQVEASTREALCGISTATVATILHRRGLRNQYIQGVSRLTKNTRPMVGQAFTLRHIPAPEDIDVAAIFADP